jgi:long-subunit fatty acid transport protein
MRKGLLTSLFIIAAQTVFAQNPNLGASGAQFLQIPIGSRAEAMGGAVVGLADDASAVFWNPAGIVKVNNFQVFFSYINWFELFDLNAASIVYNAGELGSFGASMIIFNTGKMEITTETEPNGTGRYFDAGDLAIGVSYARYLTDRFSVGVSVKYVYQNLTIAMAMTNFGGDLKYDGSDLDFSHRKDDNFPISRLTPSRLTTEEYPLPLNFQVGIGFDVFEYEFVKMKGAIDVTHPNDNKERAHFGTEFSFFDRLYLRGGYKLNYDDQNVTFGAGINLLWGSNAVYFDYAYSVYDILPAVHRISLKLSL